MKISRIRPMRNYFNVRDGKAAARKVLAVYPNGDGKRYVHWQECFGQFHTFESLLSEFAKWAQREVRKTD